MDDTMMEVAAPFVVPDRVFKRVEQLENDYATRDIAARRVRAVRSGDWDSVAPGMFTEDYPAPMVANRIDVMARDVAASLAPLPAVNCQAPSGTMDAPKAFAEKRTKIANHYVEASNLKATHADHGSSYNTYGLAVYYVRPDFAAKSPRIEVRDGSAVYPVWDSLGRTMLAAEVFYVSPIVLEEEFHYEVDEKKYPAATTGDRVKVVRYCDRHMTALYLPECGNEVLFAYDALVPGKCPLICIPRPAGEKPAFQAVPRGAYDDLVYPQLSANEFAMLMLEAAHKQVEAPIVTPLDVGDISYGPDATIRTAQGFQSVGKLKTEDPATAAGAMDRINQDLAIGGMSPESRTGNIQASVITGKGIEAASAGYSSQIAQAQIMLAYGLEQAVALCFEMDERLWPDLSKEIRGMQSGVPFKVTYKPSKDIKGDYTAEVSYGFLSGMAPNNALVWILQAQAAGLISKDFASRQLPVAMNVSEQQRQIDIENMRGAIMQSMAALSQSIPQFVMSGQDATGLIRSIAEITKRLQKGEALEDIVSDVLAPEPPPAPAPEAAAPGELAAPGAPGSELGGGGSPLQQGIATEGPNGRPDLNMLFAGMNSGGKGVLQGGVSRQNPVMGQ